MPARRFTVLGAMISSALLAAIDVGGAPPAQAQQSAAGPALRVGIQDDPDALDPATSGTYTGRFVFAALCDKLVDIGPDLSIVPQLAVSWQWDADQKGITFRLRPGVTFHDGTPFDAQAVKFNIERMQTMSDSRRKAELSAVAGVEVLAPDQVHFTLKDPFAPLLSVLSDRAGMMVSPAAAREGFAAHPVCAGPYAFAERKARDLIRLTRFAQHWDAASYGYGSVSYVYVPDSTVRLARVRAGDLEVAERIAPTDLKTVRDDRNLQLASAPGLAVSHLMVNVGGPRAADSPLAKDSRLRRAFELSLDRAVINRVAFNGEYVADNQMIPPSDPFHAKGYPAPRRDVAAAKALVAQAGAATPVPVEITFENALTDARVAQIVQSMAKEAGFDVKLLPLETTTAIERYLAGNFEMYVGNWSGRGDPDPTLYAFFACNGGQNVNRYCNRALEDVLNKARSESNTARRAALYEQATGIYLADLPTIPLYHPNWLFAARANVTGLSIYPDGLLRLRGVKPAQ